jgi:heptosyltransferase-2/heptosyltransferase-3
MNSTLAQDDPPPHTLGRAVALSPIVIRLGALGDMLNLSALLHFLHLRYGRPCVVLGAGPWTEPVYRGNPDVAQVWTINRHIPLLLAPRSWQLLAWLRTSAPSPIYVCDDDKRLPRVQRLLSLSGVDARRTLLIGREAPEDGEHHLDRLIRFGQATPPALRPEHFPPPASLTACLRAPCLRPLERAALRAWILAQGWSGRPLILVQIGNRRTNGTRRGRHRRLNRDDKCWPSAYWTELLRRVHAHMPRAMLLLCGAPGEASMLRALEKELGLRGSTAVAALPLRRFFALCELAHSMISVDTGPAHAAAALRVPLVVLFGAQRQSRWLPRGPAGTRIVGLGGPPRCTHVAQIPVDEVFSAWRALAAEVQSVAVPQQDQGTGHAAQRASESISAAYACSGGVASPATLP